MTITRTSRTTLPSARCCGRRVRRAKMIDRALHAEGRRRPGVVRLSAIARAEAHDWEVHRIPPVLSYIADAPAPTAV